MPSLNNLPVELVLKTLRGASLKEILNVTRTSTYFRKIGYSYRSIWKNAQDADRLPLPIGETLDTLPLSSIGKLAAYAIALSALWHGSVARPLRVSHVGPCPSQRRSLHLLTSPFGAILPGNRWLLIDMDTNSPRIYCPSNGELLPLSLDGIVVSYTYESSNNGAEIIVAILKASWGQPWDDRFIDVYILELDPKHSGHAVPSVKRAQSIHLPSSPGKLAVNIDLRGSLVVVSGDKEIFIVNWKERSGLLLYPSLIDTGICKMKVYFHPNLPLLVAEKHTSWGNGNSIHMINFSPELAPFVESDLAGSNLKWRTELFSSTCIHALESYQSPKLRGFHRDGREPPIFYIIYKDEISQQLSYLSVSGWEEPTPETSSHDFQYDPDKPLLEVLTTAGHTMCHGRQDSEEEFSPYPYDLAFLRIPPGIREGPSWFVLQVPEDVTLEGTDSEVLAFDDIYGTLLLHDAVGNYCIVQY